MENKMICGKPGRPKGNKMELGKIQIAKGTGIKLGSSCAKANHKNCYIVSCLCQCHNE